MSDKSQKEMIQEIHEAIVEIRVYIFGVRGTKNHGLAGNFEEVRKSHFKLKRNFWILIGVLAGSGVIGTSIWQALGG